ncbi:hypothetical protein [Burkholderia sp. Ax-1719]|uniref:hypothetical protein n=1 Tax=Burkholderia sp. Ax-1719 TaxID=2608334 RepID=UPI001421D008|nr:hypothetical protein [Burkholderia sp. Ax-1719]NIE67463.1 hypothetical protein [Burkholderia sp. Ax-1719]
MSEAKHRIAFNVQRHNAKRRGIGWDLTFEQWIQWWGEDIERRGTGPCCLQMQRFGDSGPYALGNIKKGTPHQNSVTASIVRQNEACERAATIRRELSAEMLRNDSGDKLIQSMDDDDRELFSMFWPKSSSSMLNFYKS